ncbi:MAG: hypothetical protein J6A95_00845 [Clostridia bacterium]|nr:hypothetical protein [Clostridia bacterium]
MPEFNEYKITINLVTANNYEIHQSIAPTENGDMSKPTAKEEQEKKQMEHNTKALYGFAKNLADKYISHSINTIALRTGYEEQQAKYQMQYGLAKRGLSILEATIGGALSGGPIGGAIGLISGVTTQAIDISNRMREIEYANNLENTQIFFNQIRMGAGSNRGNYRQ